MSQQFNLSASLTQNWDKNGNIYYTDENGKVVAPHKLPYMERLGRRIKAFGTNLGSWLNNTGNEAIQQEKLGLITGLLTLPFGGEGFATSRVGTSLLGNLTPFMGKKIAQNVVQGMGAGGASGLVEGGIRGIAEGENPVKTALTDGTIGLLSGSAGGYGLGKLSNAFNKFYNPWFINEGLKSDTNVLKYIYDKLIPENSKRLPKMETSKVINNLRMESRLPNGRGAYTKRGFENPRDGVIAQYYPTQELKNNFKVRNFETSKYNELAPNNDETAQLYYDTLKGVKERFGKKYDTVSLHPVEDYKNMRLFLAPDKSSGFAIQPDGDIVSVFGSKKGSGSSHSMLELALQNKGTKLDNYDVPDLRNIYNNHNFEIIERSPWNDEYWNPNEWDKAFMQKEYGLAEPDITFRQIYDTNIYPEMQKTKLFETIIDTFK